MPGRRARGATRALVVASAIAVVVGCGESRRSSGSDDGSGDVSGGDQGGTGGTIGGVGSGGPGTGIGGSSGGGAGRQGSGGSDSGGTSGTSGDGSVGGEGGDGASSGTVGATGGGGLAGSGAGAGAGGRAGDVGVAGSGGVLDCPGVAELFPTSGTLGSLDGRVLTLPCAPTSSDDCNGGGAVYKGVTTRCMGSLLFEQDFLVGGIPGVTYQVTMHFYGIAEPKNYGSEITRESGSTQPNNDNAGATPAPFAFSTSPGAKTIPESGYMTNELRVLDQNLEVERQYFLNSDTSEGHWTYVLNYERTIPVIGGGRVRMRVFDPDCRMIKNCFNGSQGTFVQCGARARTVNISAAMPPPDPLDLRQPGLMGASDQAGQWLFVNVIGVSSPCPGERSKGSSFFSGDPARG